MSKAAPEVHTESDAPVTRVLKAIDRLQEQCEEQISEMAKRLVGFEQTWEQQRARLEELERRASIGAGPQTYTSVMAEHDGLTGEQRRRRAVGEWIGTYHRAVYERGFMDSESAVQWRANQTEDTDGQGGYLVPSPLLPEVVRIVEQYGACRQICRTIPMTSKTLDLSTKNAGPTVSWPGEATAPSATGATFSRSTLTAKKMVAIDEISIEVDEDSATDIGMYLLDLFGEVVAKEEDYQAFVASNNPHTGVLYTANVSAHTMSSGNTSFADVTYDDLVDLTNQVNAHVARQCRFVLSTYALNAIRKLKDSQNNPIWAPMAVNQPSTILGRPYTVSEVMPGSADDTSATSWIIYGDFRYSFIGLRGGFNVAFSDDVGFKEATRWMRVMERIAFVTPVPSAFGLLKTASS